ncbi:MAG: Holliday junction branch migration protein RuvA [Flavobacteriales bacterium]|jgi:Holliday junction DNA helicase RuvA
MIHYIKGKLVEKSPVHAVIDSSGIAYHLNISLYTFGKLPETPECILYTHFHVNGNDFSFVLYGFADEAERDIFRKLISVSGVGPNTARMVLSSLSVDEVRHVIGSKDVGSLKRIKGIGEKTAERIVIDLHDKVYKAGEASLEKVFVVHNTIKMEALAALSSLGLDKTKTEKLLDKLMQGNKDLSLEELIKQVLKQL